MKKVTYGSEEYKTLDTNADEWSSMLVFLRSGATARQEEVERARKNFWPKPGDSKEERARKRKMREGAMANAVDAYTSEYGADADISIPEDFEFSDATMVKTEAEYNALPSGTLYMEEDGKMYRKP